MPPKRAAKSASTTRPAKKSANSVPQSLTEASEVLPQAESVKLVKKHVLPGLDDEAFKEVFQQAVVKFKRKNAVDLSSLTITRRASSSTPRSLRAVSGTAGTTAQMIRCE